MMDTTKDKQDLAANDALTRAGTALLRAARVQPDQPFNFEGYHRLLKVARTNLSEADPSIDLYKFMAAKTALEMLEAIERGEKPIGPTTIFRSFVEAVNGGNRELDFGGKHIANKPSADKAYLRAAAVALYKKFPADRALLANEAKKYIGIEDLAALRKLADNFDQRHDVEIEKSRSPLSVHMMLVDDLIDTCGYKKLSNFA
jgi:hypothetical protein